MNLNHYLTNAYDNKSGLLTPGKQTQTKPILSAVALAKADSNVPLKKWGVSRMDYIYTVDETKKLV